jgi:antitoxin component of MazEF toxin-antitoxin module
MLSRKVQRIHNSKAIVIPSHLCDLVGIAFGDSVNFGIDGKTIMITPASTDRQVPKETGAGTQPGGYGNE